MSKFIEEFGFLTYILIVNIFKNFNNNFLCIVNTSSIFPNDPWPIIDILEASS